jgi:hypothetical protein
LEFGFFVKIIVKLEPPARRARFIRGKRRFWALRGLPSIPADPLSKRDAGVRRPDPYVQNLDAFPERT